MAKHKQRTRSRRFGATRRVSLHLPPSSHQPPATAMPPVRHSEAEESNFLDSLFSELDSTTAIRPHTSPTRRRVAPLPPPRTPVRANKITSPSKRTPNSLTIKLSADAPAATLQVAESIDINALLDGAEDWDWDDMNSDFMTPRKSSPVKPKVGTKYGGAISRVLTCFKAI